MAEYIELGELQKFCKKYTEVDAVGLILAGRTNLIPITTIIPDNATNGDMIKAMFPNVAVEINANTVNVTFPNIDGVAWFELDFWDAQYRKVEE